MSVNSLENVWYISLKEQEESTTPRLKTSGLVNPKNTTKMCSSCGKLTSKELSDRIHERSLCGLVMDRDLNASKNIVRIGMDSLRDRDIPIEAPTPLG